MCSHALSRSLTLITAIIAYHRLSTAVHSFDGFWLLFTDFTCLPRVSHSLPLLLLSNAFHIFHNCLPLLTASCCFWLLLTAFAAFAAFTIYCIYNFSNVCCSFDDFWPLVTAYNTDDNVFAASSFLIFTFITSFTFLTFLTLLTPFLVFHSF